MAGEPLGQQPGQKRWVRRKSLIWRRVGDEGVILDAGQRVMRGLNLTGWRVWRQLDGDRTLDDICADFATHYGIPLEQASGDVQQFIAVLRGAGLVDEVRS